MKLSKWFTHIFIILIIATFTISVETVQDFIKSDLEDRELAGEEYYAQRVINVHQPVYQPGYGNFQQVKPLFLTPPPPVVQSNNMIQPTQVYNSRQVPIHNKVNVMNYPQQFQNMFNHYQFPQNYQQFAGQQSPMNPGHPYNMLYGPNQYQPVPAFGLPYGQMGHMGGIQQMPAMPLQNNPNYRRALVLGDDQSSQSGQQNQIGLASFQNPQEQEFQQNQIANPNLINGEMPIGPIGPNGLGFNQVHGVQWNPFSAQSGPFGNMSPYSALPARKLRDFGKINRKI